MSAATVVAARPHRSRRAEHLHLPSVHVRQQDGSGFDYEEDLYIVGRNKKRRVERIVTLMMLDAGERPILERATFDVVSAEEIPALEQLLSFVMRDPEITRLDSVLDPDAPTVQEVMEERGRAELARQIRIAAGEEAACASCGCSTSRACSGGCLWATKTLCSRCI
jgi:hypothetical protein